MTQDNISQNSTENTLNQVKTFTFYTGVALAYSVFFTFVFFFLQKNFFLAIIHTIVTVTLVINYLILLKTKKVVIAGRVILVLGHIVITLLYAFGGWGNVGYFWAYAYLPYVFYLPRKKEPIIWIILLYSFLLCSTALALLGIIHNLYTPIFQISFYFSLLIETALVFLLQISRDALGKLAQQQLDEVSVINKKLDQKLQEEKDYENNLKEQTDSLQKTKRAMLNLMEDVRAEKDAAEKERIKDEAILNSIGDAIIAVDTLGNIEMINPITEILLGWKLRDVIHKPLINVFTVYDESGMVVPQEKRPIYFSLKAHIKYTQTYIYHKDEHTKLLVSITSTPIVREGEILGVIEILRDVTREREVDRMKTEFISLASHQLRTPLSAIKWFIEMLLSGDAGTLNLEQSEFAHNISESTERMIQLVNALLNISRIESGRIMIDPKPTDLKDLVHGVVTDLKAKIEERRQTLSISVNEDLPKINLDPRLIRQVYMNLLTNAIKYTQKQGDIEVIISRRGDEIISQVSDNGYGIPASQQGKIFQKFFRAENVAKIETDGTGLGLYLIKAIIESSKGKIWFRSEEGKGTSFWFSLPISGMVAKKGEVTLDE